MHAFITIGSTEFDALISETLSPRTLKAFKASGYETLTVQCGNSVFGQAALVAQGETAKLSLEDVAIELWKFKPSLREEYEKADLIVSHAGKQAALGIT
jgi:beta-1,4-N-acetylglucosaminyltransferase